jgi:polyisoprenoid-binding protein YceI
MGAAIRSAVAACSGHPRRAASRRLPVLGAKTAGLALATVRGATTAGLAFATVLGSAISAQEYHVDRTAERRAAFLSEAPIEAFEGVTDRIDGYVVLDGDGVRAVEAPEGAQLYFEVDLASLDTGIGLRNRHMRDNYLEVEEYPWATFSGDVARILEAPGGWTVRSRGTFTVHGVEQPRVLECAVSEDGDGFAVACAFDVNLGDHDIEIPRVMFLKLAEDVRVDVSFRLRPAPIPEDR